MTFLLQEIGSEPVLESQREPVTVLVTGYGPFLDKFPTNSSWSIASTLPKFLPPTASLPVPIRLIVPEKPLRVSYANVASITPKLLAGTYEPSSPSASPLSTPEASLAETLPKPDIVLHIGLAAGRKYYTLEQQAPRGPFDRAKDVDGHVFPKSEVEKLFGKCPHPLKPTFDTEDVWRRWRSNVRDDTADLRPSNDPGHYLCGFIYYLSMAWYYKKNLQEHDKLGECERPVVFLHVPDLPTEPQVEQGRLVALGLIKALVASREKLGVVDPLNPGEVEVQRFADVAEVKHGWDGVSDFVQNPK